MNEELVLNVLENQGIDLVASLPCDKNRRLTALLPTKFQEIVLAREEDGVGICAGAYLGGKKPVMSIQSSGLGNMLNALMSLSRVYSLPLPILASWRGVCNEVICAQIPFNEPLPKLLDVYSIPYRIFSNGEDLEKLAEVIAGAYEMCTPYVALIKPSCWEQQDPVDTAYPLREAKLRNLELPGYRNPEMKRLDAIRVITEFVDADNVIVSNIGHPSKELYASKDRMGNFYMLGSYTQASAIGLGCAIAMPKKRVIVIDGDGSLLGSAILPIIAAKNCKNLTIVALDNGTFGSTGDQISPAYTTADLGFIALGAGIVSVERVCSVNELHDALRREVQFIHVLLSPGNSVVPNILLSPIEIRDRFMRFCMELSY
ncbi:MAG TPA: sulfopyruvate decarboxylase subunit alpha [Methanocorpusculum sp.]|nr:sulfopyruvate decarboxylase subunit alpha [Methanocorpusculum sp.]HJJ90246.1 sulfopyruvate decarboxylase subunit alpha [Methanocorpusculum sp.]